MRPHPWSPSKVATLWLDFATGTGVHDSGQSLTVRPRERRKHANLADMLDAALEFRCTRIMLTGDVPSSTRDEGHWLFVKTPGWSPGAHWFDAPATGRFTHDLTGHKVEVKLAAEWFGDAVDHPREARDAWLIVEKAIADASKGHAKMFLTPGGTGTNMWALSLPENVDPGLVADDIAEEIHATSGQHRIEHLTDGPGRCATGCAECVPMPLLEGPLDTFAYVDGRFMYAACMRELGVGPGRRLTGAQAADLLARDAYARARYKVRVTVPDGWPHVGLLAKKHDNVADGWHYPNRPGASWQTWADGAEVRVALNEGWVVEPLEAVEFDKARVLDTFADRMTRAREKVSTNADLDPAVRRAAAAALRAIVIQTIGSFASRGRSTTQVFWNAREIPAEHAHSVREIGGAYVVKVPGSATSTRQRGFYRPELAAQVWGRARARVLIGPSGVKGWNTGALEVGPEELIGINGDAIYTTCVPEWALDLAHGGGDDGKVGRLRLQGVIHDVPMPATSGERNTLRAQAEAAGIDAYLSTLTTQGEGA